MSAHALPTSTSIPASRTLRPRSDEALRAMVARGDAGAFAAVYERHGRDLYRYCRSILGHDEDAHDALHNAMIKAWEALGRGDHEISLRPWLFRIARNEAIDLLRRRRSHAELDAARGVAAGSVEEDVELRQRLARLQADLAVLPERQRSALLLRELCGLGHDEIAAVLVVSSATARQTIYEARVALGEAEAGREMACVAVQRALSDGDGRVWRGRRIRGHLRACSRCASFGEALRRRPEELAALVPPPGPASAGMLAWFVSAQGGASTAVGTMSSPTLLATTTIAKLASGTVAKVVVGSVMVATAGGAVELERHLDPAPRTPSTASAAVAALDERAGERTPGPARAPGYRRSLGSAPVTIPSTAPGDGSLIPTVTRPPAGVEDRSDPVSPGIAAATDATADPAPVAAAGDTTGDAGATADGTAATHVRESPHDSAPAQRTPSVSAPSSDERRRESSGRGVAGQTPGGTSHGVVPGGDGSGEAQPSGHEQPRAPADRAPGVERTPQAHGRERPAAERAPEADRTPTAQDRAGAAAPMPEAAEADGPPHDGGAPVALPEAAEGHGPPGDRGVATVARDMAGPERPMGGRATPGDEVRGRGAARAGRVPATVGPGRVAPTDPPPVGDATRPPLPRRGARSAGQRAGRVPPAPATEARAQDPDQRASRPQGPAERVPPVRPGGTQAAKPARTTATGPERPVREASAPPEQLTRKASEQPTRKASGQPTRKASERPAQPSAAETAADPRDRTGPAGGQARHGPGGSDEPRPASAARSGRAGPAGSAID